MLADEACLFVVVGRLGVVADGALEGRVADALAAAAVLRALAVPALLVLEGGDVGDAVLPGAGGLLAGSVLKEARGGSGWVGGEG